MRASRRCRARSASRKSSKRRRAASTARSPTCKAASRASPPRPSKAARLAAGSSRYRRIFNDRTGLASARNQRPFLLQTYRRDMGGGNFVVMKEAAAPITVNGKHWGGLRLAFHF